MNFNSINLKTNFLTKQVKSIFDTLMKEGLITKTRDRSYFFCRILYVSIIITVGSFLYGYSLSTCNITSMALSAQLNIKQDNMKHYYAWMTTMIPLGAAVGAGISVFLVRFGRKWILVAATFGFVLGASLTMIKAIAAIVIGRMIQGLAVGFYTSLCPILVKELSPRELHSYTGGLIMLQIALGQLVANLFGLIVPGYPMKDNSNAYIDTQRWRAILGIAIGIGVIFGVTIAFLVPDSPKFLLLKGKPEQSKRVLNSLYNEERAHRQMKELVWENTQSSGGNVQTAYKELFTKHRMHLGFGLMLSIYQQLSGVATIYLYSSSIFVGKKTYNNARILTMVWGLVNFICCGLSFTYINRLNRRYLLLGGFCMTGISLMIAGICQTQNYTNVGNAFAIVLIGCFQLSLGPGFWIYISETLPDKGVALVSATNWATVVVVSIISPYMCYSNMDIGGLYLFFMAFQFLGAFLCLIIPDSIKHNRPDELTHGQEIYEEKDITNQKSFIYEHKETPGNTSENEIISAPMIPSTTLEVPSALPHPPKVNLTTPEYEDDDEASLHISSIPIGGKI